MKNKSLGNFVLRCNHLENHQNDELKGYYLAKSPNSKNMCPLCFSKKVQCSNPNCNNIIERIYIKDNSIRFCSQKCQRIYNSLNRIKKNIQKGYCFKCGKLNEHRDALGFGIECKCSKNNANNATQISIQKTKELWKNDENYRNKCQTHEILEYKFCKKCNKETLHNGKFCTNCNIDSKPGNISNFIIKNNVRYYKDKELTKLCKDLLSGKENICNYPGFEIRLDRVCYNRKDILTDEAVFLNQNFQIKNKIKYYKNEPVEIIIRKLNCGKYDVKDFLGWNKRFGEWYYNSENILTGEIDKLNNSLFYKKDEELWYFDKESGDYTLWKKYKEKFLILSKNIKLSNNFKIISTFRRQDSEDCDGSKQAFEQSLIDLNIGWFVYIKFYINKDNKSIPLVCGKSGSLLVNNSGSDLSFSTDINDGPARRFLLENNHQWDKTRIAILKCDSEKEAYLAEQKYLKELNLFGS